MRLGCSPESSLRPRVVALLGYAHPPQPYGFPHGPHGVPRRRRPPTLVKVRVHPRLSFAPSPEFIPTSHLPATRMWHAPSLGFHPPQRPQSSESTPRRTLPSSSSIHPQRFSRSRRFPPRHSLQVCFTLLPPEVPPSGALSDSQPPMLSHGSCPPDVSPQVPVTRGHASTCGRASKALLRLPTRCHRQVFYACQPLDPLLSFHFFGFFFARLGPAFTAPPLMDLPQNPQVTSALPFSVSIDVQPSLLSPEVLPVQALWPHRPET
jgi:hypothetical protein